jgi:streptogramin lyase
MSYRGRTHALTNRRIVLLSAVLVVSCGQSSAPVHDAAIPTLDVVLFSGVKNVTAMVAGPDGNLWLATSDGTIARTTMAGQIDVFPVGLWESGGTTLAKGPDGYLWLGNWSCKQCSLARVATDGTITEVLVEQALRPVEYVTNAPDGSVWFSGGYLDMQIDGGGLARVTNNGVERARAVACVDFTISSTWALVMDPDYNAWLTVYGTDARTKSPWQLLRVAPDGSTTQHEFCPLGTSACTGAVCCGAPGPLVIGSDGNLWFGYGIAGGSQGISGGVARMNPSGSPSYFPGSPPDCMTLGPDGNIWSAFGSSINRITPSGDISHFLLPDGAIPQQMAAGPDGNLWLALKDGRIGRVSL